MHSVEKHMAILMFEILTEYLYTFGKTDLTI
jgi:hypothetical protein